MRINLEGPACYKRRANIAFLVALLVAPAAFAAIVPRQVAIPSPSVSVSVSTLSIPTPPFTTIPTVTSLSIDVPTTLPLPTESILSLVPSVSIDVSASVSLSLPTVSVDISASLPLPTVSIDVSASLDLPTVTIDASLALPTVSVDASLGLDLPSISLDASVGLVLPTVTVDVSLGLPTDIPSITDVLGVTAVIGDITAVIDNALPLPTLGSRQLTGLTDGLTNALDLNATISCALSNLQCCGSIGMSDEPVIGDVLSGLGAFISSDLGLTIGIDCDTVPTSNGIPLFATCDAELVCCTGITLDDGSVGTNCTTVSPTVSL